MLIRRIDLGQHEASRRLDLQPAERLGPEFRQSMQRVDGDHDVGDDDVVDQNGIGADCGDDGAGIGEPAGLQHDLGQSRLAGRNIAALVADAAQFRDELVAAGAATAAAGQHDESRRAAEQRIVDRRLGGLVDDDDRIGKGAGVELVAQPGGLARPEKPAEDRQAQPAFGRTAHRGSAPSPVKRGSSGSTGRPHMRSAAIHSSSRLRTMVSPPVREESWMPGTNPPSCALRP